MRMTRDEFRFAWSCRSRRCRSPWPTAAYRLIAGPPAAAGALLPPTRILAIGVAGLALGLAVAGVGWYLGRRGRGPLASSETARGTIRTRRARGLAAAGARLAAAGIGLPGPAVDARAPARHGSAAGRLRASVTSRGSTWATSGSRASRRATPARPSWICRSRCTTTTTTCAQTHPASSPWWAWPLDLKPVWFEQSGYAGGTTAVIYDTGNIILSGSPSRPWRGLAGWRGSAAAWH